MNRFSLVIRDSLSGGVTSGSNCLAACLFFPREMDTTPASRIVLLSAPHFLGICSKADDYNLTLFTSASYLSPGEN